ncbi:MAG: c-type cytochrome, partial [Verrucomicrobiota bacterium]
MKKPQRPWWWWAALIGAALAVGGFLFVASGVISLKASSGHWKITEWVLRFGMDRSIATHSLAIKAPDLRDPRLVVQGAGHFEMGCRSCHGAPGLAQSRVASAMLPVPPELWERITGSSPEKLFYAVKHGMKFTGMPAWPTQQRDDEVWATVAFLLKFPTMDAAEYRRLAGRGVNDPGTGSASAPAAIRSCVSCHGADGMGGLERAHPRLAGQRREYLEAALQAYAMGRRHSGTMGVAAAELSPTDHARVAEYFTNLNVPATTLRRDAGAATDNAAIARGRAIAHEGLREQKVPACIECHGPGAKRGKPEYPLLAGQSATYLELQLTLFKEDRRGGSTHAHLMQPIASRLSPEQMREVS